MSIVVEVRKGNLEKAMRVLKKKVQKEGIVKELRAKQYYQKPSEIKREKKKEEANLPAASAPPPASASEAAL